MPDNVIRDSLARYKEALQRLMGQFIKVLEQVALSAFKSKKCNLRHRHFAELAKAEFRKVLAFY